jgi:hypothetical protein
VAGENGADCGESGAVAGENGADCGESGADCGESGADCGDDVAVASENGADCGAIVPDCGANVADCAGNAAASGKNDAGGEENAGASVEKVAGARAPPHAGTQTFFAPRFFSSPPFPTPLCRIAAAASRARPGDQAPASTPAGAGRSGVRSSQARGNSGGECVSWGSSVATDCQASGRGVAGPACRQVLVGLADQVFNVDELPDVDELLDEASEARRSCGRGLGRQFLMIGATCSCGAGVLGAS